MAQTCSACGRFHCVDSPERAESSEYQPAPAKAPSIDGCLQCLGTVVSRPTRTTGGSLSTRHFGALGTNRCPARCANRTAGAAPTAQAPAQTYASEGGSDRKRSMKVAMVIMSVDAKHDTPAQLYWPATRRNFSDMTCRCDIQCRECRESRAIT